MFCLFCLLIYCLFSILLFYLLPALLLLYFCTKSTLCHLCHPYGLFSLLLFAALLSFLNAYVLFTLFHSVDCLLYLLQYLLLVLFNSGFYLFPKPYCLSLLCDYSKFLNYFTMKINGHLFHGTPSLCNIFLVVQACFFCRTVSVYNTYMYETYWYINISA
jgi:hypothetical protein